MRAIPLLAATLVALPAATPAQAEPLELGALVVRSGFEKAERFDDEAGAQSFWGKASVTQWSASRESGASWRVVELVPARPAKAVTGYLARWRASHGCTANEVKDLPRSVRDGKELPQLTFEGSCKGGDRFVMRVLVVDGRAYELHADARVVGSKVDLRAELKALLERVELRPPEPAKAPAKK